LKTRKAIFVHSHQFEEYKYPPDCPFKINRAGKVRKVLNSMGLLTGSSRSEVAPEAAEKTILEKFHTNRYLDALQSAAKGNFSVELLQMGIGSPDCPVFNDMYDYSALACGATLTAADLILAGEADLAFNPSGGYHHAGTELAEGFCYINDVALACLILAQAGKRVFYLDIDVHHGDGVANAFFDSADVMTVSFHESGRTLFPGSGFENEIGTGDGKGYCVNVPLPIGTYDKIYMNAFKSIVIPLLNVYDPNVIVFELGADALAGDPLAHLRLTNNTYAEIVYHLLSFNKPILMTGGGGYNIDNTVRAWALAWSVLCGADIENTTTTAGMGGVMLENVEWQGGLRDRQIPVNNQEHNVIDHEVKNTIGKVKANIFGLHGLHYNE